MLPNWYGIDSIAYECRGAWSDPLLHYKGHVFNGNDVQDGLWEAYRETLENTDNSAEWEEFVVNNAVDYLEDIIAYGFGS
jgi:hypothetical protein